MTIRFLRRARYLLFVGTLSLIVPARAQENQHILAFESTRQLRDFFQWTPQSTPLVSGHRGGMEAGFPEAGFPENSIAAFENTLKHTPAFFEIDPRLTKDSVIILMHDATLDRTTTGTGRVADYTWEELRKLKLKDAQGRVTPYGIPTLAEVLEWARGKTVLNFDKKDVPPAMTAAIIRKHRADTYVMLTVHTAEQALYYYRDNPERMFSAFVKTPQALAEYERAGVPWANMIAYIGPEIMPANQEMYQLLHARGVRCMISAAPTYDKLKTKEERAAAYQAVIRDGASVLESDLPIEAAEALKAMFSK